MNPTIVESLLNERRLLRIQAHSNVPTAQEEIPLVATWVDALLTSLFQSLCNLLNLDFPNLPLGQDYIRPVCQLPGMLFVLGYDGVSLLLRLP